MVEQVRRAEVLQRLRAALGLEPTLPGVTPPLTLSQYVVPVVVVGDWGHLVSYMRDVAKDLSAAAGTFVSYFTVGADKRWRVYLCTIPSTTANSSLAVKMGGNVFQVRPSANTYREVAAMPIIVLNEADEIGLLSTGNVGDNSRTMGVAYLEEDHAGV